MDKKLDDKLVQDHPIIFKDRNKSMQETAMCWGFPGNGWYKLIDELCTGIEKIMNKHNLDVTAVQVKEKFGGLRFYVYVGNQKQSVPVKIEDLLITFIYKHQWNLLRPVFWKMVHFRQKLYKTPFEKIYVLIDKAEAKSYTICEQCGKPGKTTGGGWLVTLCNECGKEKK